jgi:hypothetical protein
VAAELQSDERSGKSNNFRWTRRRNLNIFIQERGEREREREGGKEISRDPQRGQCEEIATSRKVIEENGKARRIDGREGRGGRRIGRAAEIRKREGRRAGRQARM